MPKYLRSVPGITRESFAAALSLWYAEGRAAAMADKVRKAALGEAAPAYSIAMARAKLAAADFSAARILAAEEGGEEAAAAAISAERAYYDALRALYAFSGVRVSSTDGEKLLALFVVRLDKAARVKLAAPSVNGEEYVRIRRAEAVKDCAFRAEAEALQAARLAEIDFVARAAEQAEEAAAAEKLVAEKAKKAAEEIAKKAEKARAEAEKAAAILRKAEETAARAAETARKAAERAQEKAGKLAAARDKAAEKAEKAAE